MPKPPRVDFQALIQNDVAPALTVPVEPEHGIAAPLAAINQQAEASTLKKPTLRQRTRQQSLYLEHTVYEALREIAFVERKALHALFLEGIDAVLKKRGLASIRELVGAHSKAHPVIKG